MFILLVGLTWVSLKSNQVSKKFNNNLTASSSHGQYPRLEMTEVWSVSLESLLLQSGCWDERAGGALGAALGGKRMATNPGTQPWGTPALIHQQEMHMTFGYECRGTGSEPLRPGFNSKKCHDPYSPPLPRTVSTQAHHPHWSLCWDIRMEL